MKSFINFRSFIKLRKVKVVSFFVLAIIGLNILFLNAGSGGSGDLPPPGSVYLDKGHNSTVYRLEGDVYKIVHNGDTVTRDNLLKLHNSLAEKIGINIIPPYQSVGNNTLRQTFVEGLSFEELSTGVRETARQNAIAIERIAGREAGKIWSGSNRAQPIDRIYTLEPGSYAQIDATNGFGNYKYNPDGSIKAWYDPVMIGNSGDLLDDELRGAKPVNLPPKTNLPIDNGEALKIAQDPTATGASNLQSVKTFTFLTGAMGIAGFALILNDYVNQFNAASTDQQRQAAHTTFLQTVGILIGVTIVAGVVIATLPVTAGAAALVTFTGIGAVGLGSHIYATFGNDILALWDKQADRPPTKPDANHPLYAKLKSYQNQQLQLQLKRIANADNRSNIEFQDLARVAVLMDPDFQQKFVSAPNPANPQHRTGFMNVDLRQKELFAFRTMTNVYHEMKVTPSPTQADVRRWSRDIWKIPVQDLYTGQLASGLAMNYPVSFGAAVYQKLFERVGAGNWNQNYMGMLGTNFSSSLHYLNWAGPNQTDRITHTPKTVPAGTLVASVSGVAPSYALTPIAVPSGSLESSNLLNDPNLLKRIGTQPVPIRAGSVLIVPEPGLTGWCYDSPAEIQFLGNGVSIESDRNGTTLAVAAEVQGKAGSSAYSSFAFKDVTSNQTYEVNGGMQSCHTAWVAGCGVTEQLPWTPTTGITGGPQSSHCLENPMSPGCPCFANPWQPQCL